MRATFVRGALSAGLVILVGSAAGAAPQERAKRPAKPESRKAAPQPETRKALPQAAAPAVASAGTSGVTYALKDIIRAKSGEFCAPYGGEGDCIQEIEICLAMVDRDGDPVRLCVNSAPQDKGEDQPRSARFRP
ncbi:MAG TPA: hypothetical protein VGU45_01435 [Microvirga sp.]|jgi:hypothetical protein|nr:hypothetical protein [Microvirga sp.]